MINSGVENVELAKELIYKIKKEINHPINIMEVCGTHTMSIYKYGIDKLLNGKVKFISGPGCPVCVTSAGYLDAAIRLLDNPKVIVVTFADMLKVPGTSSSLMKEKASGKNIKIIFTPYDLIKLSQENKDNEIVFLGVGFETIAPIYADVILKAKKNNIKNLSFIFSLKKMPNIIKELLNDEELKIDGLLCPGHVAAITGTKEFEKLAKKEHMPMIVSGFNSVEILSSVYKLVLMIKQKDYSCLNYYKSVVQNEGNKLALLKIDEVFEESYSFWRGIGKVDATGFALRENYSEFDAEKKYNLTINQEEIKNGCKCGEIIKGKSSPLECKLFKTVCTPSNPLGPCMVSGEGTCGNYYKYH